MTDQLKALIRLQNIDSKLDQVDKLRGDLPEDIKDLEDEITGLETRINRYKTEAAEGELEKKRALADIKESEAAIERYDKQQLQVRNNREYDALTKEIDSHKARMTELTAANESWDARDAANGVAVEEATTKLKELKKLVKGKQKDLEKVVQDTEDERAKLDKIRAKTAKTVDERYLKAYDRLRTRLRDGRAVVALVRGAAAGFAVPPQRQVEVRQKNRVVICEHTGRIIVDEGLHEEVVKKMKI